MHKVVSLMSGTSLDGVDIAYCEFDYADRWSFSLIHSETIEYDKQWMRVLSTAPSFGAFDLAKLNVTFGEYLGKLVSDFCAKYSIAPDFVASHGHTVFHQPMHGVTVQIGSGAAIASRCFLPVVCDFRTMDVALGGQGAPLVPIGDKLLFSEYDYCLNLGGIANISYDEQGERKAFDICGCNIVLNLFASKRGLVYDKDGELAANGRVNIQLLDELNGLPYYSMSFPKSLGREDIDNEVLPIIEQMNLEPEDVLATFTTHIAEQIARYIIDKNGKLLITGGGAFNKTLVYKIASMVEVETIVPDEKIINFKEAIVFGFLGVLRMRENNNTLMSVTGAQMDNCGGAIYYCRKD